MIQSADCCSLAQISRWLEVGSGVDLPIVNKVHCTDVKRSAFSVPTSSRTSLRQSLRMLLPLLSLLGVLALVIMACGGTSDNAGTSVGSNGTSNTSSSNTSKHFKVGDQVKVGDTFIVTVNSFKTSPGDEFDKPKSGNVFVVVDITIKNVSNERAGHFDRSSMHIEGLYGSEIR